MAKVVQNLRGNKGEWSEVYVLFKLLGGGYLEAGNENLEAVANIIYPIIKIIRNKVEKELAYDFSDEIVIIRSNMMEVCRIPVADFISKASELLQFIKKGEGSSFAIPELDQFLDQCQITALKAGSQSKADIRVVIHDTKLMQEQEIGFSIKSQIGGTSTLLNSSEATNFIYEIQGWQPTDAEVKAINSISDGKKIKSRTKAIIDAGGNLKFRKILSQTFESNLVLIDSCMPKIVSEIILLYYLSGVNECSDSVIKLQETNPLQFNLSGSHKFYEYKIKRLLSDIALGMTPSTVWTGVYDATGGYIVVKDSGDILCYHVYNRNEFENYLLKNTKLDSPSSTRHKYGVIYRDENQKLFFRLNLQIRFI